MSNFLFHDISYAQGLYNMDTDPYPAIEMKMSGFYYGSKQPYLDVQANRNYGNAIRLGKVPILYHFAGGADPVAEANYFITVACAPLAKGDIYELDYELNDSMAPPSDPDSWCRAFADRVKELTGVYPLFYTYTYLLNQHGNFPKTLEVCGLIQANYVISPEADIPGPPYIVQQYTDTPIDTNASFISLDTLKKYAYGYTEPIPAPPTTTTTETTTTTTTTPPTASTSSTSSSTTLPPIINPPVKLTFWQWLLILIRRFLP